MFTRTALIPSITLLLRISRIAVLVFSFSILCTTATVESQFSFTRKLDTINVFPANVSSDSWKNVESVTDQNVSEDALYQEFKKNNSAYLEHTELEIHSDEMIDTPEQTLDTVIPNEINSEDSTTDTPIPLPEDTLSLPTAPEVEVLNEVLPAETSQNVLQDNVFGFFQKVVGLLPLAQEVVTVDSVALEHNDALTEPVSESSIQTEEREQVPVVDAADDTDPNTVSQAETDDGPYIISFKDFAIPELASGQFITNVQLRMSLGALLEQNIQPSSALTVEYTFGDTWENAGEVSLDEEVSNALNGGYFLFALPTLPNADALKNLQVRVSYVGELGTSDKIFIDALWLEVHTETFDRELLRERLLPAAFDTLALPHIHELLSDTLDFTREENPSFVLRYESQRNVAIRFLRSVFGRNLAEVQSVTFVRKGVGIVDIEPTLDVTPDGLWTIQIPDAVEDDLEPGTYTIEITVNEGGKLFTDSFDFQWGLLAVNPDKTEYEQGESSQIALAALSPGGNTLCDANLSLYIIDPNEFISRVLVTQSGLCNGNNVIDVPDYTALFTPDVPGEYEMYVEHLGKDGEVLAHTGDTFRVVEHQPLGIMRNGQTRIYPRAPYTMSLTVTNDDPYSGVLTERVPHDFSIVSTDGAIIDYGEYQEITWDISLAAGSSATYTYEYDAPDISPFLYTLGPATLSGTPVTSLSTSTPDIPPLTEQVLESGMGTATSVSENESPVVPPSPEIPPEVVPDASVGEDVSPPVNTGEPPVVEEITPQPLDTIPTVQDTPDQTFDLVPTNETPVQASITTETNSVSTMAFTEHRAWQIASDATGSMIVFWTDGATIPSGWTCISCTSTSTFYQRFPKGGSTYGTTAGIATSTHTVTANVNATTASSSENNAGTSVSISSHGHSLLPTIGSTTTLPAYRQLRVIQNNSAGTPATIPAGAVLVFDSTLPSGWAQYTPLDARYPRGENTITSSSTNTHIHTMVGTTSSTTGSTYNNRAGGTQASPLPAINTHTHTLSTSTVVANHEPPYIEVIFATSSTATATPLSAVAMWSDTPPAGWLNRSAQAGDPFYDKFIKGSATYGTTGGADTHTHVDMSATTSSSSASTSGRTGATGVPSTHTHTVDFTNFTTASNSPPSVTVIYAKYLGLVPVYTQSAFWWYANTDSITPTDAWPSGTDGVGENEAIDASFTALKNTDVIRLRMQLNVTNSTTTGEDFKLQFGTTTSVCTAIATWTDVGSATSSVAWIGYDNPSPSDGTTLSSSTLTGTDYFETYEEQNPTAVLPNAIGIGQEGEWDYVLKQNSAVPNTTYCFRMVKTDNTALFAYTQYPMLVTNIAPNAPVLDKLFNNEKVGTTTPQFEFAASDPESDTLTYQIQIDNDYTFGSIDVDKNTASNPTQFSNITRPSDKDPYRNGETIRFSLTAGLTNGTTYYWRVRAQDPTGSNNWGSWSTIESFTIDTSFTTSAWFQTMEEQFDTDTLVGTDALVTDLVQLLVGSTTGTTTSSQIDFTDATIGNAWGSLSWNDDETVGDIKYRIQYYSESLGTWQNIPDADLSGNAAGFDTSPISLLSLDTDTYSLIRIVGVFTNSGGSPLLYDWTITWGYRIVTPTLSAPFSSEKVATTTPTFEFETTDPQGDDLVYEVQWSTSYDFAASTTRNSASSTGFINIDNGGDFSPFFSGNTIQFTVQPVDILTNTTTYWWRVRARDPLGSNQFSLYTSPRSFTVDTSVTVSTWFQTTQSQFSTDVLSGTLALAANTVTVATTSDESLIVYAEGNITTPRYREWDGTIWGSEANALSVGASINWVVTRGSPIENEYITGTLGTDADVNIQVFRNGAWGNLQEVTTSIVNTNMRGFDIAYEQTSGDAVVVTCDGDADPAYYVWNGTAWVSGGTVDLSAGNSCGWVKLISNPTSDEIILISRDTSGTAYETLVWNGSAWGTNRKVLGSMQGTQTNHEGIAAEYEDSGNQAVIAVSNGANSSFTWTAWGSATWTVPVAVALGDDFEAGVIVADDGTDNLALCYVDEDRDIGVVRWTGASWPVAFLEHYATWGTGDIYNDRPIDCAYEVGGSRDGYLTAVYATTTAVAYQSWNGATWSTAARVSTFGTGPRIQARRTGNNLIQVMEYASTTDRYDYSYWNGTSWSTLQTLETDASVGATPFKEPLMNAIRSPGVTGSAVVSPGIDFYDGSGPYWQQLSWVDSEPGGSTALYQVEYYSTASSSWTLVPDSLIPGNSSGTTTSPINLANVLPVSTYSQLRPVANMNCNLGSCPTLSDWTVTWAAGIGISGAAQAYDQSTNVTSGTVGVALNGVLQTGKTGTISGGTWSIANVNASPGDVVTVFINGANDANEAVAVTHYDGVGDISGMRLYERHLALGSNDATTTPFTNADIGLYDYTNSEDLFFNATGTALSVCVESTCGDAELYIMASSTYQPTGILNTPYIENNGTFNLQGNTVYVSRSWDNNATTSAATSTVVFTATSTSETIDETGAISPAFYNLTFGTTTGNATWTPVTALDVNGALTITRGTLSRNNIPITIAGNLSIAANGLMAGMGTTTFDGTGTSVYTDSAVSLQNIGRAVVDGTSKTIQLGNNAKVQSLTIGADDILDVTSSNYGLTVMSSFNNLNTFIAQNGTTTFAGTTTSLSITAGSDAFYNLAFTGAGGSWSFTEANLSIGNNFVMSTGTVTLPTGTSTISGSFANGGGTFAHNNATILFNGSTAKTLTLGGTAFTNAFYNVRFEGSGSFAFTESNATTSNDFRIAQGTVTFLSSTLTVGGNFENTAGTFAHNSGTVRFTSATAKIIDTNSSFYNLAFAGSGSWSFTDASVTAVEDVTTLGGSTTFPSNTFTIGGSLVNTATINPNGGTVLLNSVDTGEIVNLGSSSLNNLTINSGTGGWTISAHATTTGSTTLTAAGAFTLASGQTLSVGTVFTNSVGGASTTWAGSTLTLEAGAYSINTKTAGADVYGTLRVKANTDIKMWNSSAGTYTVDSTGSLYSQDHASVDGDLYIFGGYDRVSGTEYWSSATDFDGTSLATSSRQVNVRFASGSSAAFSSSTLNIVGTSTATTTIQNQGSGTYTVSITAGTTTAQYYSFADLGATGVSLSGNMHVASLANGSYRASIGGGTGMTISSTTIDANPGLQIYSVEFATSSPVVANNVKQIDGTPASYWWFRNSSGSLTGESFDLDTGNPGSIRWDDSSLSITVSGTIYTSDGTTPLGAPVCGVGGTPVRVVVEGGAIYDGSCNGSGVYSIPGVVVVGDPTITVFLNGAGGGTRAATVTKTPTADITGIDLIASRVITRHQDVSALTIGDMAAYDSSDDADIPFTAATGTTDTLTIFPDVALHVWATTTFTPGGPVTLQSGGTGTAYDGSLYLGNASVFTGAGTTTYSIGGSFTQGTGATFIPASSTVAMTATTTGKGLVAATGETISLNELQFTGVGGGWNLTGALSNTANIYLATGTFTGTGNITLTNGSFYGNGLLSLGSGTTTLTATNTLGGTQSWTFGNLVLGTGSITGTTSKATTATTTILGKLTIGTGHFFNAFGSVLDLQGAGTVFVENGTFIESTSTVRYSGTSGANVLSTSYNNLRIIALGSSPTYTATGLGIIVLGDLTVGGASTTTFTLDTNDPAFDVNGNVTITPNGTFVGSGSGAFTVAGSWDNDGTFTGSGGTVTFDGSGTKTIAAGNSSFSNVTVNTTGDRTITESATTTSVFTLTAANTFTVSSGVSLAVGSVFTNALGGAATVWTGSTLFLYGGGNYQINASTINDVYSRLTIGAATQIRMWNSSASTTDLATTASLYSQDHAAVDGTLNIYGAYTKTSGNDYWSYANDFDGTALGGGSRKATVKVASGASVLYTGGGLSLLGTGSASTSIQNQGSGTYSMRIGGSASTTWSYYDIANFDASGLTFSGTPVVSTLSFGEYTVGIASGTAITVGGTVITQNSAKTFTTNRFSTTTGISGFNVTATGTTASSWRFTNHGGAIAGEAYDVDPNGDPGYIVWDNSSANITISGRVYSDEGTTVSTACTGTTTDITLRVAGLTTYQTTCNAGTGAYSISGVTYSPGDSFVVYIDGRSEKAATVSEDPVTSVSDLDLYENRVIVRHESADPLSIADMSLWDSSSDADIPFTAVDSSPDTLSLPANRKLIVWAGKEFLPNGNVTVSGGGAGAAYDGTLELQTNAIFNATGAETHTIGGSLIMGTGATLDDETSTLVFTTTGASRTIDTNDQNLYNLTLNGSGSWTTPNTIFGIDGDLTITQGTITLPTGTTTVAGSFLNTGGTFSQNGGQMRFTGSGAKNVRTGSSAFGTTTFAGSGNYTYLGTNATTTGDFTILSGTVTSATGTLTIGGNFTNSGIFAHSNGTLRMISSRASTTITASTSDLSALTIAGSGTFRMTNANATLLGTLSILQGTLTLASGTLSIGGSFINTGGTFAHASGTILFNSTDTGETIAPGGSDFNIVSIAAPTGGYSMTENATTTGNFSLTSATSFTLQNGKTLTVRGVFTNLVGGSATTWANSTLKLLSGSAYTANTKAAGGDVYNLLILGQDTDLRLWNSSATTTTLDSLSSLYSQDNAAVDGELYIYGNYTRTTGTDYWSYATDFDGTSIATSSRAVTVRHAQGATSTFSGGALEIIGASAATTTITNQGSGTYALSVTGGALNAQYYALRNINSSGFSLSGATTITSLAYGDFELAVSGGALITVSSTTINYNAASVITGVRFATTTAITGVNVAVAGTTSSAWTFTSHRGNLAGESYDTDGGDACGSIRWDNSSCLLTQQSSYRWRADDGGEGVPDSEWYDTNWSKRKRVTIANADAVTYTNAVVEVTIPYDSDMQTDFDDLRVTNSSGTTTLNFVRETYTTSATATLWVKIPSLAASANTVIYIYYGNGGATNGGVGTTTFGVYDDFEDGNITEYSGDTTLFVVDGSFANQGSYGLKANNPSDRTTDGIYRTDVTVSQGQTVRYMQYINTGAGSGDETCTLFGVQSPGANNNNYAVCLEQFGVDRVSIAKNVYDNDTNGTVLASTTITYATGWYEVEVDWKTNNTIDVSVYKDNVLKATTTATDSAYTSGGIGFTYWFQNGGWDFYTSRTFLTTEPTATLGFEQVRGGASWSAAVNTRLSSAVSGSIVRPRFVIENTGLQVTDAYRLMYASKGVSPSCEAVSSGSYTAVPLQASCAGSPLCMQSSTYFTNNASSTDVLGGTGTFTQGQIIENPSNTTQSLIIPSNNYTEVEYAITITNDATDPSYCLRVTDSGTDIDSYTRVAEMGLVFVPNITSLSLNGGADITLTGGATTTVTATGTVTDQNGYADLVRATTTIFRSGVGASCTVDNNNCYVASSTQCSFINCSGNSCDVTCSVGIYYFADPTDIGTYAAETWRAQLSVADAGGSVATATAPSIDLLTLRALAVNSTIDYGSLTVNADTGSYNATSTIQNTGNGAEDISVDGTNLTDGASSLIPVNQQKYATSTFTYSSCVFCSTLSASTTNYEVDLSKPTTTASTVTDYVFWGISVPFGVAGTVHYGSNTFYAIGD